MDAEKVGKRIAALRKEKGLTQKELAAILHVTDKAVSKWERGLNFPELTLIESLASALNTTVLYLLSLEGATGQEVVESLSAISLEEKKRLLKELKWRAVLKMMIEILLLAAFLCASKIFADNNIYGLAQAVTMGMMAFVGTLIGLEIYSIKNLSHLT